MFLLRQGLSGGRDKNCEAEADIVGFRGNKIFIIVKEFGAELCINVDGNISSDGLECICSERVYRLFERIRVQIKFEADKPYRFRFTAEAM